jgi:hypothetical protein
MAGRLEIYIFLILISDLRYPGYFINFFHTILVKANATIFADDQITVFILILWHKLYRNGIIHGYISAI